MVRTSCVDLPVFSRDASPLFQSTGCTKCDSVRRPAPKGAFDLATCGIAKAIPLIRNLWFESDRPGDAASRVSTAIPLRRLPPIERARHRLFPKAIKPLARFFVHLRFPPLVDCPVGDEFVGIMEEADCQSGGIGSAESSG